MVTTALLTAVALSLEDEHDDDLESEVHEGAEQETDAFPNVGDELDDTGGESDDLDDGDERDEDEAEL